MQTIIRISVPKTLRATRPRSTWPRVKRHALLHTSWALWLFCKTLDKNVSPELSEENASLNTQTQLLSAILSAQFTAKSFHNFPIFFAAILLDYLVSSTMDKLHTHGNSIPLPHEEPNWQLEVRCWPWLSYPLHFSCKKPQQKPQVKLS